MFINSRLSNSEHIQSPLQNIPKRRPAQLLEELVAHLGKEDGNLIFAVLLLITGVFNEDELGGPGQRR